MLHAAGHQKGLTGARNDPLVSALERDFAFEHVERLVLAGVDMQRGLASWADQRLTERECSAGLVGDHVPVQQRAGEPLAVPHPAPGLSVRGFHRCSFVGYGANVRLAGVDVKQRFGPHLPLRVVSVELRHLRSFVAVAEELNFTRAAARVHLAQQALSAQIRQLEDLVGARLFARTTRKVELTAAGRALLERLPTLLEGIDRALDAAVQAGRGETGELGVGLLATAPLDLTPRLLRAFAAARPRVVVSVRNYPFDDPSGGLRDHRTDVALVWLPFTTEGLVCEPLFADPRMALLPADHPLAARAELEARDLVDEPIVWIDDMDPVARDFWTLADHRPGRPPRIGARVTGFEDLFAAVRAGQAIAACPSSVVGGLPFADVVARPVRDIAPARVAVCRRADDENPAAELFVQTALALRDTDNPPTPTPASSSGSQYLTRRRASTFARAPDEV